MKKLVLSLCIIMFVAGSVFSQVMTSASPKTNLVKKSIIPTKLDADAKYVFADTIAFVSTKWITTSAFLVNNGGSTIVAASQYFRCPQSVTVNGFIFYADADAVPSLNVTCQLYAASATKLPTGAALATATVTVDSLDANGYKCIAVFPTPVLMTGPYCVTVTNNVASSIVLLSTANGNGLNQNLSGGNLGAWANLLTYSYNIDWLMFPIVSYDIPDVYFTKNLTCINNGDSVAFDMTAGPVYSDSMYSYFACKDSVKYQFQWNFGDGSPLSFAKDTNHTYATAAPYTITLYDTFVGWYFYITRDTTATIDMCVGLGEISSNEFRIYPNPVNNVLNIVDAENSTIEILSIVGTTVKRIENATQNEHIDMNNLSNGTYFVRISSGTNVVTRKISVIR